MLWAYRCYYQAHQLEDLQERGIEFQILDKSDDCWPSSVILAGIISLAFASFQSPARRPLEPARA